jgi:hypothetical protein
MVDLTAAGLIANLSPVALHDPYIVQGRRGPWARVVRLTVFATR